MKMSLSRQYCQDAEERQDVIRSLNEQRLDSELCDVILVVGEERLPVHRCVLSASSHYFRSMFAQGSFAESSSAEVKLFSIDSNALKSILDLIYLGTLTINLSNVYSVLEAADLMLMEDVKKYCADFFIEMLGSNLALDNVLYVRHAAQMYSIDDVNKRCERFVTLNFPLVVTSDGFTTLPLETLKHYISSDNIQLEDEEIFLNAAMLWITHNDERRQYIDEIMSLIRFPLLSVEQLVRAKSHPLLKSAHCQGLMQEAMLYQLQPMSQCSLQSSRTKPRINSSEEKSLIYCMSGVADFRCYLPAFDRWYALRAPCNWPDELEGKPADNLDSRLVSVRGYIYACIVETTPEEVGSSTVKAILRYDIGENEWKCCRLPSAAGSQCRFIEAQNDLFACSADRIECYKESTDSWETVLQEEFTPCEFIVAYNDWVYLLNLESGIAQNVRDLVNSQRKTTVQTQAMTPSREKVINECKMSKHEVLLTTRSIMGVSRKVFNANTHEWREVHLTTGSMNNRIPSCMITCNYIDMWNIAYDQKRDRLYILSSVSGLSDLSKRDNERSDGVLPFYEVELNTHNATWTRLSSLPEGVGKKNIHLCMSSGYTVMPEGEFFRCCQYIQPTLPCQLHY